MHRQTDEEGRKRQAYRLKEGYGDEGRDEGGELDRGRDGLRDGQSDGQRV